LWPVLFQAFPRLGYEESDNPMSRLLSIATALALAQSAIGATVGPPMGPLQPPAPDNATAPGQTSVRDLGSGRLQVGCVTLDRIRRIVAFPVIVNQSAGPVEYAVVTPTGKIHESIFRTPAEPRDLQIAFLLLGARPVNARQFDLDPASTPPGEPVAIEVTWQRLGRSSRRSLAECVRVTDPPGRLAEGPWVYNGSFIVEGVFAAQATGSVIALQEDPAALINNPRPGRFNDELHRVNPKALPPRDKPATLIVRLANSPDPHASRQTPSSTDTPPTPLDPLIP